MTEWDTADLAAADKKFVWHPFTPMGEWCAPEHEPIVLVKGQGALLWDSRGREYVDGNSSIWTNIHGHNHPAINAAIKEQLERVAHTSFLGFTNPPAIELARKIVGLFPENTLSRVFYSDDGSTGIEAALRIVEQYWRIKGQAKTQFVAFDRGYHGDTAGAAALGANTLFGNAPGGWNFPARRLGSAEELKNLDKKTSATIAAVVIEPLVQGAAGIRLWPKGTLKEIRQWCDENGALLIADEVLTGFGRTGTMFACEQESVSPDLVILGKGLTAGYLPLAITLLTDKIFSVFKSDRDGLGTLSYGHSYTGNALGCAAALASLKVFEVEKVLPGLLPKIEQLRNELKQKISGLECVAEIRQCGFIAGIQIHSDSEISRAARICVAARKFGLLTRPIRDVIVLMPPFCITRGQLTRAVDALVQAIEIAGN